MERDTLHTLQLAPDVQNHYPDIRSSYLFWCATQGEIHSLTEFATGKNWRGGDFANADVRLWMLRLWNYYEIQYQIVRCEFGRYHIASKFGPKSHASFSIAIISNDVSYFGSHHCKLPQRWSDTVLADYGLGFIIAAFDLTSIKAVWVCRWTALEVMKWIGRSSESTVAQPSFIKGH